LFVNLCAHQSWYFKSVLKGAFGRIKLTIEIALLPR